MTGVGHFTSAQAQASYLALYDELIAAIPGERETRDVSTTYGQVRVYRFGSAEGTPFVLLHGRGATSAMWEPNIPALAAERTVYAIDSLGEPGRSIQTLPIASSADQAAWLTEVFDVLGIEKAHVAGLSGGGWLTFNLALHSPSRIATATLIEPANVLAHFSKKFLLGGFSLLPGLPQSFGDRFLGWVSGDPDMTQPIARLLTTGMRAYRMHLPIPNYGTDDLLRSLQVPVLALLGGRSVVHDPLEAARRAQTLIPHNETELWPEATHALSGEFPDQLNARLLNFAERA
ncbi:alpha/beta fold hydrolase [Kribbella antibiotica]|uniref:alpha/beta fold hydrolase n=1 Tax=Kribbella antibiotica TaxID=190195 RepID=UPI001404AD4E|nr:alpha/beta fold hydrolase [Kribbella antibiotica]